MIPVIVSVILSVTGMLNIAKDKWGPLPCGTPTVVIQDSPEGLNAAGWVDSIGAPNCTIHIDPDYLDSECEIIVHEYGHLAGQLHSDDPKNIMYNGWPMTFDGCYQWATELWTFKQWDNDDYELWYGLPQFPSQRGN